MGPKLEVFFHRKKSSSCSLSGVHRYAQFQPAGSAVNNSNSGALLLGRGLDMLGWLQTSSQWVNSLFQTR